MKEDTALAFGIAAFFLALTRCWLRPSMARFAVLGAAAALAVSGKYIGALVVPLAFVPVFRLREERRRNALVANGKRANLPGLANPVTVCSP
jgi:4-amino-4-deoxy-L-arabinose transferase-like glycosyltransferase